MNVYDFDKTIYRGDSTADFYLFSLKRHKKILLLTPSLLASVVRFYVLKKGTKTDFKQVMYRFFFFFYTERDVSDFWQKNESKIKAFYLKQQQPDDVIISASPVFLLAPICQSKGIRHLIASKVNPKTGVYSGINCQGDEKVRRFYETFPDGVIDEFYSDSYSDTPLAELSKKAFLVDGESVSPWIFKKKQR